MFKVVKHLFCLLVGVFRRLNVSFTTQMNQLLIIAIIQSTFTTNTAPGEFNLDFLHAHRVIGPGPWF